MVQYSGKCGVCLGSIPRLANWSDTTSQNVVWSGSSEWSAAARSLSQRMSSNRALSNGSFATAPTVLRKSSAKSPAYNPVAHTPIYPGPDSQIVCGRWQERRPLRPTVVVLRLDDRPSVMTPASLPTDWLRLARVLEKALAAVPPAVRQTLKFIQRPGPHRSACTTGTRAASHRDRRYSSRNATIGSTRIARLAGK